MKHSGIVCVLVAAAVTVSGCATKRYGRLQPVTAAEKQVYDCRNIEVEIAKVEGFRQQVAEGAKFNGASAMGFLGDWGIGNANEKNAAERTATERMNDLLALKAEKGCNDRRPTQRSSQPQAESQPDPDQAEDRKPAAAPSEFGNDRVKCTTCM